MCGFTGFYDTIINKENIIEKMMDRIVHRGPDMSGHFCNDTVALGFRRLSIIDLECGSQPMYSQDKNIVLVFNGEIYNFNSIRQELESKGYKFSTHTDSEVLVHGYVEWGGKNY